MTLNRRDLIHALGGACSALALSKYLPAQSAPFAATRDSLKSYQVPEWFRDAKFGIWAHWGPQSAIGDGDWYARNMYMQDSPQYLYHCETYGHPSKVGYKDLVHLWKADKWDPDHLMSLYKQAGAKYFVSMGVHRDNFDLWNSKYHRWNSVKMGPRRDVVGEWQKAARKHGLRFGVTEHLWISYKWLAVSHSSDKTGPMAGVPYDGVNPAYADLYHDAGCAKFAGKLTWNDDDMPTSWKQEYLNRITDLIDKYQPDLLYTDGHLPFEEYGLKMVSHLYNLSAQLHGGVTQAVYNAKKAANRPSDCAIGTCVLDHERGEGDGISTDPWQTDTCIGDWFYKRGIKYKTAKQVIHLLVDIVSKNGNLLLNFPPPNSGELDFEEMEVLNGITTWMQVNSEGIYSTRPWKIYGEGPSTTIKVDRNDFNVVARMITDPVWYFYLFWFPKYLQEERGMSLAAVGRLLWLIFVAADLGSFAGGVAASRRIRNGGAPVRTRVRIRIMAYAAIIPCFTFIIPALPGYLLPLTAACCAAFAHMAWMTNVTTLPLDIFPTASIGSVQGMAGTLGSLASLASTTLIAFSVTHLSYAPVFYVASCLYPLAFIILLQIPGARLKGAHRSI